MWRYFASRCRRHACHYGIYFWAREATRLRRGYGAFSGQIDYLGARELTIFSKHGSPCSGSQNGMSFNWP